MSDKFLEGFVHIRIFAEEVGRSIRTVKRWTNQPDGLPFMDLGRDKYIPVERGRSWMRNRIVQRNPRRR